MIPFPATTTIPVGRIVDLSQPLIPEKERYTLEIAIRRTRTAPDAKIQSVVYMWSHTGTHVEAPFHYTADGADVSGIAIDHCVGPAIVLDFHHKLPNEPIGLDEIRAAGDVQVGDRVMLYTGADTLYRTPQAHACAYPTPEACEWLVQDRKIRLFGTDSGAFDVHGDHSAPNHRILLKEAGIPVIECLANLGSLRAQRVFLVALPLPVRGLDACPIRAIAIEP